MFRCRVSAPPQVAEAASLIEKETLALQGFIIVESGLVVEMEKHPALSIFTARFDPIDALPDNQTGQAKNCRAVFQKFRLAGANTFEIDHLTLIANGDVEIHFIENHVDGDLLTGQFKPYQGFH